MSDKKIPPLPEPLSLFKLHSPEVQRQHRIAVEAHYAAKDEARREAEREAQAAIAHANRVLDANEYFALCQERENANRARDVERQAAAYAAEQEKAALLASNPPAVSILEQSDYAFLNAVAHWLAKGYEFDWDAPHAMIPPMLFQVSLKKKSKAKA